MVKRDAGDDTRARAGWFRDGADLLSKGARIICTGSDRRRGRRS